MPETCLVIGISGVTNGGKTTLAKELTRLIPSSTMITQDTYFLDNDDARHTWIPELNHVNYDIISSLDMEKMHSDIQELMKSEQKHIPLNYSAASESTDFRDLVLKKLTYNQIKVLIIEGFCIFGHKPIVELCKLKYFLTLPKELCRERRNTRSYEPPDCPGYFDICVWPEYMKHLPYVLQSVSGVKYFDEDVNNHVDVIFKDIDNLL